MVVKLWHCACPCNTAFLGSVAVLMAATFPVWDPAPWFWRQQGISSFQRTVFALYCLGAARRNGHKVTAFVSSNRELTRDEKWWTFLENTVRESNKSQPPGKRFQWRHKSTESTGGKAEERVSLGTQAIQKHLCILKN